MQETVGEVKTNLLAIYSCGPTDMDKHMFDDQLEPI